MVGLPARPFLYTLDQIATLIAVEPRLVARYLHYQGRSVGAHTKDKLLARNIAPVNEIPEWRVAEPEFIRWLKYKGFRIYDLPWTQNQHVD